MTSVPGKGGHGLDGAVATAQNLSANVGDVVVESARAAFTSGLNLGAVIAAVLAVTRLKHVPPTSAPTTEVAEVTEQEKAEVDAWRN